MNESEIIIKLARGEESAFELVFRKYFVKLCQYAEHYLRDKSAAEEIVEDFFVFMWDNCEKIEIESNLAGYLFRSIHNRCLKYLRHENVKKKYLEKEGYLFLDKEILEPVSDDFPEATLVSKEFENQLNEAISALPDQCRKVFELSRYENMSYQDISKKLDISVNTVKTHMTRALQSLRDALKEYLISIIICLFILMV